APQLDAAGLLTDASFASIGDARIPSSGRSPARVRAFLGPAHPKQRLKEPEPPMADDLSMNPTRDDFAALLEESLGRGDFAEGTVVKGRVAAIEKDFAIIDVGLKTEGRIPVKEFGVTEDGKATLKVGDSVEVFLERVENAMGEAVISRDKARREEAWTRLEA